MCSAACAVCRGESVNGGLDYWTGLLEWNTEMTFDLIKCMVLRMRDSVIFSWCYELLDLSSVPVPVPVSCRIRGNNGGFFKRSCYYD